MCATPLSSTAVIFCQIWFLSVGTKAVLYAELFFFEVANRAFFAFKLVVAP